jgi:hypothetical protein
VHTRRTVILAFDEQRVEVDVVKDVKKGALQVPPSFAGSRQEGVARRRASRPTSALRFLPQYACDSWRPTPGLEVLPKEKKSAVCSTVLLWRCVQNGRFREVRDGSIIDGERPPRAS